MTVLAVVVLVSLVLVVGGALSHDPLMVIIGVFLLALCVHVPD